jgi:asparagine synthase (glutamine-hydrolysing)
VLARNALWMSGAAPETIAALCRRPAKSWLSWYVHEQEASPASRSSLSDVLRRDLITWLVDDILLKLDKMSMAASLEARAPFLDHELVEFVARLPLEDRLAGRGKRWLRQAFARELPATTARRAKLPFRPPIAAWMRGPLGVELRARTSSPSSFASRYLDRATVDTLLTEHSRGRDHSLLLWNLLVHEVWWSRFFTGGGAT